MSCVGIVQQSFGKVEGDGRIGRAAASGDSEELDIMMDGMAWPIVEGSGYDQYASTTARLSFYNIPIGSEIQLVLFAKTTSTSHRTCIR